ncbi:hypothetical protein K8R33_03605 [archaeon]|nr:hypothetical protein [archaeon]
MNNVVIIWLLQIESFINHKNGIILLNKVNKMSPEEEQRKDMKLTREERTFLDQVFERWKLCKDATNEILGVFSILHLVQEGDDSSIVRFLDKCGSRHYLQRIQECSSLAEYEYIKLNSDPEAVRKFDEIVDILNNETETILKTRDEKRANELADLYRELGAYIDK